MNHDLLMALRWRRPPPELSVNIGFNMSSPSDAAPCYSVGFFLSSLFFIVQDHTFCPQRFAIAVVKEEVGSQGTVSERTPMQQHCPRLAE